MPVGIARGGGGAVARGGGGAIRYTRIENPLGVDRAGLGVMGRAGPDRCGAQEAKARPQVTRSFAVVRASPACKP